MPLSTLFATLTTATGAELDAVLAELGALTTIACTVTGTNTLQLTPDPLTPTIAAYAHLQGFSCVAVADNTGPTTAKVGGLATLNVYKNTSGGPAVLASGDIVTGNFLVLYYDVTLNSGNGGFHLSGGIASGLPAGGSVGQPLVNTGSGTGDWGNTITAAPITALTLHGGVGTGGVQGGGLALHGGDDAGAGAGQAGLFGGNSITTGVPGGETLISGGFALVGNADGGPVTLQLGAKSGTGRDGTLEIVNATSLPGVATGTLTNAPRAGNPNIWLEVVIDGTTGWIPWWHA